MNYYVLKQSFNTYRTLYEPREPSWQFIVPLVLIIPVVVILNGTVVQQLIALIEDGLSIENPFKSI